MGDVTRLYQVRYKVKDEASQPLGAIARAFVGVNLETETAASLTGAYARSLGSLRGTVAPLNGIDGALKRVAASSAGLAGGLAGVTTAVQATAGAAAGMGELRQAIQGSQRAAYGLKMNLSEANAQMGALVAGGAGLGPVTAGLGGVNSAAGKSSKGLAGMAGSLAKFAAASAVLSKAGEAAGIFGEAMQGASAFAKTSADEVIRIRDGLRELGNLQKKPGVDDETLRGSIKLRQASGMTDVESKQFQESFEGSLPLAVDKGNVSREVATDASREIARSAVRVGLDAKTAGDLAGSIGAFGKIGSARQATGQVQQIIDQLNDGRGNLSPLAKELMKGGFSTVGQGNAFRSIAERAAGLRVTTGIVGNAGQASTALGAAIRGLTGFNKKQGQTLAAYGIESGQDLPTMLERIAPLIENAEAAGRNASATLASAGFGNKTDRDAIIGLVKNRRVLRQAVTDVREDDGSTAKAEAAGARAERMNAEFYQNDKAAANRVADANLTAGRVERGLKSEDMAIARKNAEARLTADNKLDTTGAIVSQRLRGLVAPEWLTGIDQRQKDIDEEARANLHREAERVGVKIPRAGIGVSAETQLQNDINAYGPEIKRRGGNPYGSGPEQPKQDVPADPEVLKRLDRIADGVEKRQAAAGGGAPLPEQGPAWRGRL